MKFILSCFRAELLKAWGQETFFLVMLFQECLLWGFGSLLWSIWYCGLSEISCWATSIICLFQDVSCYASRTGTNLQITGARGVCHEAETELGLWLGGLSGEVACPWTQEGFWGWVDSGQLQIPTHPLEKFKILMMKVLKWAERWKESLHILLMKYGWANRTVSFL